MIDKQIGDPDWPYIFDHYGPHPTLVEGSRPVSLDPLLREEVARVIAVSDGENDGPEWLGVFRMKDGRYAFISAGCDYTGWGCQESGQSCVADTLKRLKQFGIGDADRVRLWPEKAKDSDHG